MDHFVWKDSFNIGVKEIDAQHRLFLDYVNECYNAVCSNKQTKVTDATIYDLKVYAATHFRSEEKLMLDNKYPGLWKHAEQHAYFESQVAELEKMRKEGNTSAASGLLEFMREWFLDHILVHDKKLASFLKK